MRAQKIAHGQIAHQFAGAKDQVHQIYGVMNHTTKFMDIEAGIGVGMTDASDRLTFKLILARDLNKRTTAGSTSPAAARP